MADIRLFSIKDGITELESKQVNLERQLQTLIENNMEIFFGITFLKSEFKITNGRIDSLGIDENNSPVIFEFKRSMNENVINQGLFYLDWLLDHKADFKLLVMDVLDADKAEQIDWSMPCVICIANDFTKFDEHAVNQMQRNIKLVKYKYYSNGLILFEHLNAPQAKSTLSDSKTPLNVQQAKTALSDNETSLKASNDKTFLQSYSEAPQDKKDIYASVRDYILSLGDDIAENQLKFYVAFKKTRNIICVEVYKHQLLLHLRLDPSSVQLKKGLIEDVSKKGHWGTGDLRINLKTMDDFQKIKYLIDRAYNEN